MEEIVQMIIENHQTIIQYLCMFVAYFLVFLFRSRVNKTKTNLTVAYKESDKRLRTDMQKELDTARACYDKAVDMISDLQDEVIMLRNTVKELIGGNNEKTGTITDKETNT